METRLKRVEGKLARLERKPLSLKEKFGVHDRARRLVDEFEATSQSASIEDQKTIVRELAKLVDYSLGVKWPQP